MYINIENTHITQDVQDIHLSQKFYLMNLNITCPKWDFEQLDEKPTKFMELQTIKITNRRSTKNFYRFTD